MADQVGTAVLTLTTESATVSSDLQKVKQELKGVADAAAAASQSATDDWKRMANSITVVSTKMGEQRDRSRDLSRGTNDLSGAMRSFDGLLSSVGIHIVAEVQAMGELTRATGQTLTQLGLVATAGLTIGAGVAGWNLGRAAAGFFGLDEKIGNATAKLLGFGDVGAETAGATAEALAAASQRAGRQITDMSTALAVNAQWMREQKKAAADAAAAQQKLAQETEHFNDAMVEINSAGQGWKGTLDTINGAVVEAVKYYLEAGVSQNALGTAYALTATQVKAVASELEAEATAAKKAQDAEEEAGRVRQQALLETTKLWNEYNQIVVEQTGTTTDAQIAAIDRWAADLTAKVKKAGADTAQFYEALYAVVQAKQQGVLVNWTEVSNSSSAIWQHNLQQTADKAKATYDFMVAHAEKFRADSILKFQDVAVQAQAAADDWYTSWNDHLDKLDDHIEETSAKVTEAAKAAEALSGTIDLSRATQQNTDPLVTSYLSSGYTIGEAIALAGGYGTNIGLPHRAAGGPVSAGMPYIVGEKRPELFVPDRSGTILPSVAGGGSVVVNLSITGSLSDERKLSRAVQGAIETGLRNAGVRIGAR